VRVVITGGTGLIGGALARRRAMAGDEVIVLTRDPGRLAALAPGIRAAAWDGRTAAGWAPLVDAAAVGQEVALVHLAGENIGSGRWTAAKKQRLRDSRLLSGQAVVAAVRQATRPPAVLVQASGVSYYGTREEEAGEDAPPGGGFLAELAREWEASTAAVEQGATRRVVTRLGVVLARQGGALPKLLLPFRLGVGGRLGSGRQWFSWIHLEDVLAGFDRLLADPAARGPYNLTSPAPVRNRELTAALGGALHRPTVLPVPALALRLLLGEMSEALLSGQPAVPRRLAAAGFVFSYPQIGDALAELLAA
jgi:uncharacterized protein (TIGR01777 family)